MSRIRSVIKNKNRVEKKLRENRQDELSRMRKSTIYKAKLYEELRVVDMLLESEEVDSVIIDIPKEFVTLFGVEIYSPELADYKIEQVQGSVTKFRLSKKYVVFGG